MLWVNGLTFSLIICLTSSDVTLASLGVSKRVLSRDFGAYTGGNGLEAEVSGVSLFAFISSFIVATIALLSCSLALRVS